AKWLVLLAPVPFAVVFTAILDLVRIPLSELRPLAFATACALLLTFYAIPLCLLVGLSLCSLAASRLPRWRLPALIVAGVLGALLALWPYRLLTEYPDFAGRTPFIVGFAALALYCL